MIERRGRLVEDRDVGFAADVLAQAPPFPPSIKEATLELTVSIDFHLEQRR